MAVLTQFVALVSDSPRVSNRQIMTVSAALQKQATRDLSPIWGINATVDAFESVADIPVGYWPIIVTDRAVRSAGIHADGDGRPLALVQASTDIDGWSLVASHELLEMLVDPWGNRRYPVDSPKDGQSRVEVLVEVADPCQHMRNGYSVNSVLVSDFYTPEFFDPVATPGRSYSRNGSVTKPRDVLPGGYMSWLDVESGDWWQLTRFGSSLDAKVSFRNLGKLSLTDGSFRAQMDSLTASISAKAFAGGRRTVTKAGRSANSVAQAQSAQGQRLLSFLDLRCGRQDENST